MTFIGKLFRPWMAVATRLRAENASERTAARPGSVSVIVLNLAKAALTIRCVETLLRHSADVEVVVIDNTPDGADEAALSAALPVHTRIIAPGVNRFFGEANMIGAEAANGETLVFLNNDAFVTPGWLDPLLAALQDPRVGAAVPKFVSGDGRLTEVGGYIDERGNSVHYGRGAVPEPADLSRPREVMFGSAACMAIRRDVFFQAGGFSLRFEPAYFEDVALCCALRDRGLSVICTPASTVVHLENQTSLTPGLFGRSPLQRVTEVNRAKFLAARDHKILAPRTDVARRSLSGAPERAGRRRHRIRVGVELPEPIVVASETRYQLAVAAALAEEYDVTLLTKHRISRSRIAALCEMMDIPQAAVGLRSMSEAHELELGLFVGAAETAGGTIPARRWISICHDANSWHRSGADTVVTLGEPENKRQTNRRLAVVPPSLPRLAPAIRDRDGRAVIVAPGRFRGDRGQRFDILVEAARLLHEQAVPFRLVILGAVPPDDVAREWFIAIRDRSAGLPVDILPDLPRPEFLAQLAGDIVWHAPGGADGSLALGVMEAAALGAVPIVVSNDPVGGFLSSAKRVPDFVELAAQTSRLLQEPRQLAAMAAPADDAERFARAWRALAGEAGAMP